MNSISLVVLRALKYEDDVVRLWCFSVWFFGWTSIAFGWARVPRTDVSGSEFEVAVPTSEKECGKKKQKSALKSPLTAVLKSWLLSILHCRFPYRSVANFQLFCRQCRLWAGVFNKRRCFYWPGDWWAVEKASLSCYQEPGIVRWGAPAWCPGGCPE